ncbi:hypothetical protein AB0B13_21435 [Streptomyces sp. NPDC042898]|uniref:hypothetical protein n=1 Tax=Streptomyces sp. NPDC042898 TaxID=3154334 RepID=UPI0033DFEA66
MSNGKEKEWPTGGEPGEFESERFSEEHKWPSLFIKNAELSPVDVSTLLARHGVTVQQTEELKGGLRIKMKASSGIDFQDAIQVLLDNKAGEDVIVEG